MGEFDGRSRGFVQHAHDVEPRAVEGLDRQVALPGIRIRGHCDHGVEGFLRIELKIAALDQHTAHVAEVVGH